jgi:hypothetical protein
VENSQGLSCVFLPQYLRQNQPLYFLFFHRGTAAWEWVAEQILGEIQSPHLYQAFNLGGQELSGSIPCKILSAGLLFFMGRVDTNRINILASSGGLW